MIASMTAFGSGKATNDFGTVVVELKSVNSRFLDLQFRIPDELRLTEQPIRERLSQMIKRGKVEVRAGFTKPNKELTDRLSEQHLARIAEQLAAARLILPETASPKITELLNWPSESLAHVAPTDWNDLCMAALEVALAEMKSSRQREGSRLADAMKTSAAEIDNIIDEMGKHLPALMLSHQERMAQKLHDTLNKAFPNGLSHISGQETFERIAAESSLFSMRIDVAEELARLKSHLSELVYLLSHGQAPKQAKANSTKTEAGSIGKRLDFLFQEMNREANTLGSKSASIEMTRASMDLKLLIEQMREQAQNIE